MKYTLRQLEIFVAVGRHENVSRAAADMALSQSAASMALAEFERQFETRLFDRAGKSLRLNEHGRQLLPKAVELLDRAHDIEQLMLKQPGVGLLRVGATLSIGNHLAAPIVAAFLKRHPMSQIQLTIHNTTTIVHQVAQFELDLGMIEGECHHPELVTQPWVEDDLVVFCAPEYPRAGQSVSALQELANEAWILREPGSGTRETFEHAIRHLHAPINIRLELEHTEAIIQAVEFGLGIGCLSKLSVRDAFRRGSLVPVHTPCLDLRRQFLFVWHHRKYQTVGMREWLTLCQSISANIKRSDEIDLRSIS